MNKESSFDRSAIFRTLVLLSLPTIAEEILTTLFQYVDTAMVGHLGEQATASVSITTTVTWLINSIPHAIGVGILAMISKAFGAGDGSKIKTVSQLAFIISLVCGLVTGGISVLLSPFIPVWMGADESILGNASAYFLIISIPMVFRTFEIILGSALRAVQNTRTPMVISIICNLVNVVMNYILIYILGLGVIGAATGTAVCYGLSGILMLAAFFRNHDLSFSLKELSFRKDEMRECVGISLPVLGTSMTSCLGYAVFAAQVSGMGTVVFAAHSLAVTAETIFYIPGYGLRTACSALVGAAVGEKNTAKFETVRNQSILLTIIMMIISGTVLYLAAYPMMRLFTSSEQAAELGAQMLRIVAFTEPFFGLMIILEGIMYGLGKTKYAFFAETFGMWCVRILLTVLVVRVWKLGLREVWFCMIADNICKALLLLLPFISRRSREKMTGLLSG